MGASVAAVGVVEDRSLTLVPRAEVAKSHFFVHTVRFWSMAAVIMMHCVGAVGLVRPVSPMLMALMIQPLKFGTIGFFLISGFLMGGRLNENEPMAYLRRRVRRLMAPWTFWFLMMVTYELASCAIHEGLRIANVTEAINGLMSASVICLFHSPFWFVPNLMVGMCCLLALRKHIDDLRLGAALLVLNLFWVANIYGQWIPGEHTEAVLGFVFYLWLGAWCARRADAVLGWIRQLRVFWLCGFTGIAWFASMGEERVIDQLAGATRLNTLRLSNQVFGLLMVMLLVRVKRVTWPKFVDVPKQTFGLYLSHTMCLLGIVSVVHRSMGVMRWMGTGWIIFPLAALMFVVVYGVCLVVTNGLLATKGLEWIVGGKSERNRKTAAPLTMVERRTGDRRLQLVGAIR